MNTEILEKVRKHILEEPKRVNMSKWCLKKDDWQWTEIPENLRPPCGTVGCIAGWVKQLVAPNHKLFACDLAEFILDITPRQAENLFYTSSWPIEFKNKIRILRPNTSAYARVVSARIKHFIKTNGEE